MSTDLKTELETYRVKRLKGLKVRVVILAALNVIAVGYLSWILGGDSSAQRRLK